MGSVETESTEKPIETQTLDIPAKLLASYDTEDDAWSWGLSPRVTQIPKKMFPLATIPGSRLSTRQSERGIPKENMLLNFEADQILQVTKCSDIPEKEPPTSRPKTPGTRMLSAPVRQEKLKPDETFITDPGTFFAPQMPGNPSTGEPVAAVVRREVSAPPSACKPRTVATLNHNKTLVVRGDNEQKKPNKLALVKDLDNTTKPTFTARKPREVAKISKPKKFKSVPFQIPELSSKQKKNILTLPADKGSKLELLQKRLKYDARKYALCNIKTGSSSSESSEEEVEEEEDSSENEPSPPPRVHKEKESEQAFEKLQQNIMSNVPNIELNKNFYFHDSSLCGTRIKSDLDNLIPHQKHHLKVFMDSSGKRQTTETPSRKTFLKEVRRRSFIGYKLKRKEHLVGGYRERRESGLTVDSHSTTSRATLGKLAITSDDLVELRAIAERPRLESVGGCGSYESSEDESSTQSRDSMQLQESVTVSTSKSAMARRASVSTIGSAAARQIWAKGAAQINKKRPAISFFEESLSDADKSIIAHLEIADSLSRSTSVKTDPQGAPTPSRDIGDHVVESDEGDTSDVSVTAEDLELFDRWVEGDTPTSKDVESDRAVSVEIQQVLGIENVPYTPPQLQRIRSSEMSRKPSESDASVTVQETVQETEEEDEEVEDEASEGKEDQELSLIEFVSERSLGDTVLQHVMFQDEEPVSQLDSEDREELQDDLYYSEPTYEDVLNITGKNLDISDRRYQEDDREGLLEGAKDSQPDVTLLSTWEPGTQDPASHFSVHHFCTLAVQPQLPRVLHNITRSAHFQGLPVSVQDIRSETSLSWFVETPRDAPAEEEGDDVHLDIKIEGAKVPEIRDKQLYWTPAPPKMDLPPLFIKTHLFPKYESAIATAEQQALLNQVESMESSTSEEDTLSDETDEDDRALRRRVLTRRHGSSQSVTRKKHEMELVGPDKIKIRNRRLTRPGSAPILTESEPHSRYKSDYYTSYGEIKNYRSHMVEVQTKLKEEEAIQQKRLIKQENRKTVSPDKYEQLVRPYLSTPISDRGTLALSSSYTKLLPIVNQVEVKTKISKKELTDVKECLVQSRKLKRTTSCPCILQEFELRKRANSCNDLSKIGGEWEDYRTTATALEGDQSTGIRS
ncbi:uncharacterized protein LOC134813749 isoform X2 [Bolinopsis microptera]|uniref:uncharacterized protein LOC134813749 isoform X2 n=1 Tax=Bolinopsis microptera TaxID=2820187 RepID=UPI003079424B